MNTDRAEENRVAEIKRLFAELGNTYERAREGLTAPATTSVTLHVQDERVKASSIIKRIREIQGLETL